MKVKLTARTTVQNFVKGVAATDDLQRIIGHYYKCLDKDFSLGDHYASSLYVLGGFTNYDVTNPYDTYKEVYNGTHDMLNGDDYVNNAEDEKGASD